MKKKAVKKESLPKAAGGGVVIEPGIPGRVGTLPVATPPAAPTKPPIRRLP